MLKEKLSRRYVQLFIGALLGCLAIWIMLPRYTIVNAGSGRVYRMDRWSGDTWEIVHGKWIRVMTEDVENGDQSEQQAIELVKERVATGIGKSSSSATYDEALRAHCESLAGPLTILGWNAKSQPNGSFVVTFEYEHENKRAGWAFNVDVSNGVVRPFPYSGLYASRFLGLELPTEDMHSRE